MQRSMWILNTTNNRSAVKKFHFCPEGLISNRKIKNEIDE